MWGVERVKKSLKRNRENSASPRKELRLTQRAVRYAGPTYLPLRYKETVSNAQPPSIMAVFDELRHGRRSSLRFIGHIAEVSLCLLDG